ncbi:MAG: acyltransferase family protein [Clostridia bacterium]|nr:acyltransferase family protein [Clostridia bacterium]
MVKENTRLSFIDIAKAFAIIFIVLGHSVGYSEHCSLVFKFAYSFHVYLFFFLSGYTFSTNKKFTVFIKTKFKRIMIPYYFWALAFLIPYALLGKVIGSNLDKSTTFNLKDTIFNIIYASGNGLQQNRPLWFLPALFSMVCIYYLLVKLTSKKKSHSIILLGITVIASFVCYNFLNIILPMCINHVLIIGPIFYIGYLFNKFDLKEYIFKHFYYILILAIIGCICTFFNITISYRVLTLGNLILSLIAGLFLSITFVYIAYKINCNKLLEYIGKNTMGILIFHKILIILFQAKLGIISTLMKNSNILVELLICMLVSILAIAFSILATKIVKLFFPTLVGENGKNIFMRKEIEHTNN